MCNDYNFNNDDIGTSSCTQKQDIEISNIIMTFPTWLGSRDDCFYKKFVKESLYCCGDTEKIKCARFKENYDLIIFGKRYYEKYIKNEKSKSKIKLRKYLKLKIII